VAFPSLLCKDPAREDVFSMGYLCARNYFVLFVYFVLVVKFKKEPARCAGLLQPEFAHPLGDRGTARSTPAVRTVLSGEHYVNAMESQQSEQSGCLSEAESHG
jgi:hypothetical protein